LARLIYSGQALEDLDRLAAFLLDSDPVLASETFSLIEEAVQVLSRHPLLGRPVSDEVRELLISRGRSGYVALYSFESVYDAVLILGFRHQREVGH
jgi:plasmid stabilization system protein ParE